MNMDIGTAFPGIPALFVYSPGPHVLNLHYQNQHSEKCGDSPHVVIQFMSNLKTSNLCPISKLRIKTLAAARLAAKGAGSETSTSR